jgi:hypothetical protein
MTQHVSAGKDAMNEQTSSAADLCTAVAQEMRVARTLLEELAAVLVADERILLDYVEQFQSFDLIVQHIEESATLLERYAENPCVNTAIDGVRLTAVQQRLRATLG